MTAHTPAPTVSPPTTSAENPFAAGCAWIDGSYVPIGEARIPILDSGFARSDLTYDVVGVWDGSFFRLPDHLARFQRGLERIRLQSPFSSEEITEILCEVVRRSGLRDAYVEMIVTRGVPGPGERDPRKWTPRFYAYAIPYVWIVRPEQQEISTHAIVARDTYRIPPGAVDPTVKNFHWGDLVRAMFEAYDRDAWLPILTDGNGLVTEGPGFNVFALVDGRLLTPSSGVLEGITRKTAIELAQEAGIEISIGDLPVEALYRASELFLTSTAGGVIPVTMLDGQPVGDGRPGPVTLDIRTRYWDIHRDPRYTLEVDYS
jgi:branched-subunit amino acid aminotransferase/4-amino-4-deoxychorismate lyase